VTGRPPVNARTKVAIVELGWSTRRSAREVGVSRESARRVLRAAEASRALAALAQRPDHLVPGVASPTSPAAAQPRIEPPRQAVPMSEEDHLRWDRGWPW
jgi:hypothetical protein